MTSATLYRCDPPSLFICSAQWTGFHCEASKRDRKETQRSPSAVIGATRPLGIVRAILGGFQCVQLADYFVGEMGGAAEHHFELFRKFATASPNIVGPSLLPPF